MSNRRLEMLALGIATLNDAFNPDSKAFQLFNCGNLRAYSFKHLHNTDDSGVRIFSSVIGGFRCLVQDLEWKIGGESRAKGSDGKLKPCSTLNDLLISYKLATDGNMFTIIDFLRRATKNDNIDRDTPLSFFAVKEEQ